MRLFWIMIEQSLCVRGLVERAVGGFPRRV